MSVINQFLNIKLTEEGMWIIIYGWEEESEPNESLFKACENLYDYKCNIMNDGVEMEEELQILFKALDLDK